MLCLVARLGGVSSGIDKVRAHAVATLVYQLLYRLLGDVARRRYSGPSLLVHELMRLLVRIRRELGEGVLEL